MKTSLKEGCKSLKAGPGEMEYVQLEKNRQQMKK